MSRLMRERDPAVIWASLLASLLVVACESSPQPGVAVGVDGCDGCGMVIESSAQACLYSVDREVHTFCSPGCLLQEYEKRRRQAQPPPDEIWFADYHSGKLYPAQDVTFLLSAHVPTVMDWGIVGFGSQQGATSYRRHQDELLVDWFDLRRLRGAVDRTLELMVTPTGIVPEVVQVSKDELVEWLLRAQDLAEDLELSIRGYEELGKIRIGAAGQPVRVRMLATKPGEGFPIVEVRKGTVMGQVRVTGSHTADEEER